MISLKKLLVGGLCSMLGVLAMGNAHAALIGVTQNYPDVSLSASTLIYDANGVNATTGLLRIVSLGSTLSKAANQSTPTQLYTGAGDAVADVMLSFAINNQTGALVANNTYNKVSVGFGNLALSSPTNFGFSWKGNITNFGFNSTGTAFDATWKFAQDLYQQMPMGYAGFKNNLLTGLGAALNISNTVALSGANIWAYDWVRGQFACSTTCKAAYSAQIAPYTTLLSKNADRANSTVVADLFVPLPAAGWLMLTGLIGFIRFAGRSKLART